MTVRRFDLNLLYTLRELLKEPNTTRVGEKLGLTQSAVSAALNRLRWAFQDELLVRSGRAMKPTRRAEKLLEPVDEILTLIEQIVEEVRFEPSKMDRRFRIVSAEYVLASLMPPLMKTLRKTAPGVIVSCETGTVGTRSRLRSGHIDLALGPLATIEARISQISHEHLYSDRLVGVASKDNNKVKSKPNVDEFLAMRHAAYSTNPSRSAALSAAEKFVADMGLNIDVVCEVSSSYAILSSALVGTDLVATVPSRILELLPDRDDLKVFELPYDLEPFEVSMIWNNTLDNDAEHRWFRELVKDQFVSQQTSD